MPARPGPPLPAEVSLMAQSQRVRFSELRRAYRLIHECRDLGHDVTAWTGHAGRSLASLLGAQIVTAARFKLSQPGEVPGPALLHDHGWSSPRHRACWHERYVANRGDSPFLPTLQKIVTPSNPLVTRTREQLVDDGVWYGSAEF